MGISAALKEIISGIDFPITTQPLVRFAYEDIENDGFAVPVIIVNEIENNERVKSTVTNETLTNLAYQIDIYAKALVYDDVPRTSVEAVNLLAEDVRSALNIPGLTRVDGVVVSYSPEVGRFTLRYNCVLDSAGYFYSRT